MWKKLGLKDRYGYWKDSVVSVGWIVPCLGTLVAFLGLVVGGIALFTPIGVHYGKVNCNKFAEASNYQTRFVRNSYWSWDCYANVNGHWLPIGQVRGNH